MGCEDLASRGPLSERVSGCSCAVRENRCNTRHEKGNVTRMLGGRSRKLLKRMAPQAGFEPATLRLTGGKYDASRALPPFADLCRTLHQPAQNLPIFRFRPLPGFAALCRPLLLPKGKKREIGRASCR